MHFAWPTTEQILYRISRLRRLVAFAIAIPVCVMLLGSLLDPAFLSAPRATMAAVAVALLVTGHVALFPNVPHETISLSICVTALALAAPWIKMLSTLAPAGNAEMALLVMAALSMVGTVGLMLLVQIIVCLLIEVGPIVALRLTSVMDLSCSTDVARRQFALQPNTRRGRIATGPADANGFFDVAVMAPQVADPENPSQAMVVHVPAKVLDSDGHAQQTMLVLPNGAVTVTSESFAKTDDGCRVTITELPGDFTVGMYLIFWLTDQQMDNLTETADMIAGVQPRANGLAHGVSFLSIARTFVMPAAPVADRAD